MAVDIHGWLEVKPYKEWVGVANLAFLVDRNYGVFSVLFGIRRLNLIPLAPGRGLPPDASPAMLYELKDYGGSHDTISWVTWNEIETLEIDEKKITHPTFTTELYRATDEGLIFDGVKDVPGLMTYAEILTLFRDGQKEKGRYIYKAVSKVEEFYFDETWKRFFELGNHLAASYSSERVRIVAFFE